VYVMLTTTLAWRSGVSLLSVTSMNELKLTSVYIYLRIGLIHTQWLGGVVVGRSTCDRGSRVRLPAGALPGNLGQLSLPSLQGR